MFQYLFAQTKCLIEAKRGQGMVEYALILAFVVVVAVAMTNGNIREQVLNIFNNVGGALEDAQQAAPAS